MTRARKTSRRRDGQTAAGPIVKWAGGKTKLLTELLARMPSGFGRYYEPFAGGAALFFRVAPERAVLADANADLIETYRAVAVAPARVIEVLKLHAANHGADWYYEVREAWNTRSYAADPAARAAAFIYLNKTCYNGLWRVNRLGEFNVPIGKYADPPICVPDALLTASTLLRGAELRTGDYRDALADAQTGDFVYVDPPYAPATETAKFTSYTSDRFGEEQQAELAETVRTLTARGVQVMASNSDTPLVRQLYAGMRMDAVACARAINSKGSKRGAVGEVIVVAGYEAARSAA